MKRATFVLALLALMLPVAAWASGIDINNQFGTVNITTAGIVSNGIHFVGFNGIMAPLGHSWGSVSFSTGALVSGTLLGGGTFSSAGSSFVVTSNFKSIGQKGVIFNGSFVGPVTWTLVSHPSTFVYNFTLSGQIKGQLWTGQMVTGKTTQSILVYSNQLAHDNTGLAQLGSTQLAVPEPGTLGLLGTGLVAMAGAFRRRFLKV